LAPNRRLISQKEARILDSSIAYLKIAHPDTSVHLLTCVFDAKFIKITHKSLDKIKGKVSTDKLLVF
jgi:hypothetical protein